MDPIEIRMYSAIYVCIRYDPENVPGLQLAEWIGVETRDEIANLFLTSGQLFL